MTVQEAIEELMKIAWQGYHDKPLKYYDRDYGWLDVDFQIDGEEVHVV